MGGRFLNDALTRLTGRRARAFVVRHTHHAGRAFGIGVGIAAVTQSTQVTTFLMVGLIKAGLIRLRRAMIVLSGTNVGVCGLLFVASFDMQPLVLAILGISGIAYARATSPALRNPMAAVVGGALLIYGLGLLRHAVAPMAEVAIVTDLLVIAGRHDVLIFGLSVGLVVLLQSATAVGMLGVTLAGAGLFGIEQAMLVAFGANLGNGLNMFLLSRHLTGRARQMAAFQVSLGLVGTAVVIPLLMIERVASLPWACGADHDDDPGSRPWRRMVISAVQPAWRRQFDALPWSDFGHARPAVAVDGDRVGRAAGVSGRSGAR
ncbi:Na/Pi symporter [Tistrella bauzanensis]